MRQEKKRYGVSPTRFERITFRSGVERATVAPEALGMTNIKDTVLNIVYYKQSEA